MGPVDEILDCSATKLTPWRQDALRRLAGSTAVTAQDEIELLDTTTFSAESTATLHRGLYHRIIGLLAPRDSHTHALIRAESQSFPRPGFEKHFTPQGLSHRRSAAQRDGQTWRLSSFWRRASAAPTPAPYDSPRLSAKKPIADAARPAPIQSAEMSECRPKRCRNPNQ